MTSTITPSGAADGAQPRWIFGPGWMLAFLFVANVFNLADRAILGILTEPIRFEFALSDTQISVVNGFAFIAFNLLAGLFIARWVDLGNRRLILATGIAMWSAATALTGFAIGVKTLLAARILVGVGEATLFPAAISMIADLFRNDRQPRAMAIYQSSSVLGVMLGAIVASIVAAATSWRTVFHLFGAAGGIFAFLFLIGTRDPKRKSSHDRLNTKRTMIQALAAVLATPGYVPLVLGHSCTLMLLGALPVWAPAFLLRSHAVPLEKLGAIIAPWASLGGVAGALLGGFAATALILRSGKTSAALLVPIVSLVFMIPSAALFLLSRDLLPALIGMTLTNLFGAMPLGPVVALSTRIVPQDLHALSSTVLLVGQGLLGSALGPFIVGMLSDGLAPSLGNESLRYALVCMLLCPPIAACFYLPAYRILRDRHSSGD